MKLYGIKYERFKSSLQYKRDNGLKKKSIEKVQMKNSSDVNRSRQEDGLAIEFYITKWIISIKLLLFGLE